MSDLTAASSDAAVLTTPEPGTRHTGQGVTITVAEPTLRLSLRARDAALLASVTGLTLPTKIGDVTETAEGYALMLGPDEWVSLGTPANATAGQPLAVVDISSRALGFIVEGPRAEALLSAGCPQDLAKITPGHGTRTIYETVEIVLVRLTDGAAGPRWRVEVCRSFAAWLWGALVTAA